MKKIVIGGQIEKNKIKELIEEHSNGQFAVTVMNDLDAVMALQAGGADYYFGACNTGGGGALAMAIALLGMDKCSTLGMPGKTASVEEINASIKAGKVAFGFTSQDMPFIIKHIMHALQEHNKL